MRHIWLAAFAMLGCSDDANGTTPSATATMTASAPPPPVVEAEGIEVQQLGESPLERRFAPVAGVEQLLTVAVARGQAMVGQKVAATPASNLTFAVTCGPPTDATFTCTYEVKRAGLQTGTVPEAMKKEIDAQLSKLIGFAGEVKVSHHGLVQSVSPAPRETPVEKLAAQGVADTLEKLFVPLPRAPIGVGARWTYSREISSDELVLKDVTAYELKNVDGGRFEVEAVVTQTPARKDQRVEYVEGVQLDVTAYDAKGRGRYQLAPTRLIPLQGETELLARMTLAKDRKNDKSLMLLTRSTYGMPK